MSGDAPRCYHGLLSHRYLTGGVGARLNENRAGVRLQVNGIKSYRTVKSQFLLLDKSDDVIAVTSSCNLTTLFTRTFTLSAIEHREGLSKIEQTLGQLCKAGDSRQQFLQSINGTRF